MYYFIVGIADFFRKITETRDKDIITNKQQKSPTGRNNQQNEEGGYSRRDLHYARRIGQLEEMSENISNIKEKITELDVKFDLRVPDKVLSEDKFKEEIINSADIIEELNIIRQNVDELRKIITSKQQLTTIERIKESTEKIETDLREVEIKNALTNEKLTASELGGRLGLSRSRTNQILLKMEQDRVVSRVRYGKRFLWYVT